MSFHINTSKFKKISSDKHSTTLRHEDGHELTISHAALSPKLRGKIAEIPSHDDKAPMVAKGSEKLTPPLKIERPVAKMADGGVAHPYLNTTGYDQQKTGPNGDMLTGNMHEYHQNQPGSYSLHDPGMSDQEKMAQQMAASNQAAAVQNPQMAKQIANTAAAAAAYNARMNAGAQPTGPTYAEGGKVMMADGGLPDLNQNSSSMADAPAQDSAPQQAPVDPQLAAKQSIYNKIVNNPVPESSMARLGAPDADPDASFGPNGEAPKNFNSKAWNAAEQESQANDAAKVSGDQQAAAKAVEENKARAAAGLPPIPVPAAPALPQAPNPVPGQPTQGATPNANSDPFGTQTQMDLYGKGVGEQKAGIFGEANALSQQGKAQSQVLNDAQLKQQQMMNDYQQHYGDLDKERQGLQADIANSHIDPNHYLNSKGTVGRIATGIGLILGGMGGGGQSNQALNFLQNQISNDIEAQKADLGKKQNLLSANLHQFGNLRDAVNMTTVMQNDIVSNQLKQAAAKSMDPLAKARALQAAGQLDQQSAPLMGQMAMRKSLLGGMQNGSISPDKVVNFIVPEHQRDAANKELASAEGANKLRDNTLAAFDKIAQLQTVGSRLGSPLQAKRQIDSLQGPVLDALTKDVSGRVTPETVGLIKSVFGQMGNSPETNAMARKSLDNLLSKGMNYPILDSYGINPRGRGRFDAQGNSKYQLSPVQGQLKQK